MRGWLCAGRRWCLLIAFVLLAPARGDAQSWAWVDALGYGAAGVGIGAMAAWDSDYDQGFAVMAAAGLGGIVAGSWIGREADRRLARGEALGDGHRVAVAAGSVLAGATVGALVSAALINGEGEGTFMGSDESTFATLTVAGAVVAGALTWIYRDALEPGPVHVAPTVSRRGEPGLRVRITF